MVRPYEGGLARQSVDRGDEVHVAQVVLVGGGGHEGVMEEEVVVRAVPRYRHVVHENDVYAQRRKRTLLLLSVAVNWM